jgi:hypothetical protein
LELIRLPCDPVQGKWVPILRDDIWQRLLTPTAVGKCHDDGKTENVHTIILELHSVPFGVGWEWRKVVRKVLA